MVNLDLSGEESSGIDLVSANSCSGLPQER